MVLGPHSKYFLTTWSKQICDPFIVDQICCFGQISVIFEDVDRHVVIFAHAREHNMIFESVSTKKCL